MEDFGWGVPAEDLAGTVVDLGDDVGQFSVGDGVEPGAFGQVLADPPVEVLVGAALPRRVRHREVGRDSGGVGELVMPRELRPSPCPASPGGRYPQSAVIDFTACAGNASIIACWAAMVGAAAGASILAAITNLLVRSTSVCSAPLPRAPRTLSASQCPNSVRSSTSMGR